MGAIAVVWLIALPALAFYFLIWRPQQRKMVSVQQLQSALGENDEVMTTSGMFGRIVRLRDGDVDLEIAPNTVVRIARGAIAQRVTDDAPTGETESP